MTDLSPRTYRLGLAFVLLLAALAGCARLGTPPLWLDEASSWYNVSGSWPHLWQRALQGEDSGGLLYSVLLRSWVGAAGTGEAALRLPGVLLWLATIAAISRAVRLAWSRHAALLAAAATLAHPSMLAAARQARSYILLLFLTALALLALAEALAGRRRLGAWLLATASLGAAATHVLGVFVAIGAASSQASIERGDRRGLARAALIVTPAVAFAAAWTVLIRERIERNLGSFWIPGTTLSNYVAIGAMLVAPLAIACAWIVWRDRSRRTRTIVTGLSAFAIPVAAGPAIVSAFAAEGANLVQLRYALPLVPLGTAAAGCALATLPRHLSAATVVLALLASTFYSAGKHVYGPVARGGQDIRGAAAFLAGRATPGDALLVEPPNNWMSLAYYGVATGPVEGRDAGWRLVTENGKRKTENARGPRKAEETETGERKPEYAGRGGTGAVWLVRFSRRTSAPPELLARARGAVYFGTIRVSMADSPRWP